MSPSAASKPATTPDSNDKATATDTSEHTMIECTTCHESVDSRKFADRNKFKLRPGENLHDFEGSTASTQSLSSFIRILKYPNPHFFFNQTSLCASNVYRLFFAYTQVLQHDSHRCCTTYNKHHELNRFSDIPCIEETRVKVKHPTGDHDYIHANWVDGYREPRKFILTQAPLKKGTDQFWKMIWQENSVWCPSYIPQVGGEINSGDIHIKHCGVRRIRETYDATLLKVSSQGVDRHVLHLKFFSWGHRATPRKPTEVLNFITDVNYNRNLLLQQANFKPDEKSPIIIHCLAGTARSATIIVLDICMRKLDDTFRRPCGPMLDVQDVVLRLRTQRAMAIQRAEQYVFLHLAILEYAVRQRYVSETTCAEIDLENYFYVPVASGSHSKSAENVNQDHPGKKSKDSEHKS
ncbi:hypothetical protein Q1695_001823 [Nippostrongylus brasiliensis]|nr:hypothetical protein Q1695_001823 [Nippostrongylus brasiliensis]